MKKSLIVISVVSIALLMGVSLRAGYSADKPRKLRTRIKTPAQQAQPALPYGAQKNSRKEKVY